jgi:hypothetical protein
MNHVSTFNKYNIPIDIKDNIYKSSNKKTNGKTNVYPYESNNIISFHNK